MDVELATITVKYQQYPQLSIYLDATENLQSWHNPGHTHQAVNSVQDTQTSDKDIYSDITSNSGFDNPFNSSSKDEFSTGNQLNKSMVDKLMKDADNMAELVDLNKYVDELEIGPQRNLINTKPVWDNNNSLGKVKVVSKSFLVSIKYTLQFSIYSLSTSPCINQLL